MDDSIFGYHGIRRGANPKKPPPYPLRYKNGKLYRIHPEDQKENPEAPEEPSAREDEDKSQGAGCPCCQ